MKKFPNYIQADSKDCGPTCLKIIAKHYGKTINIQELSNLSETTREEATCFFIAMLLTEAAFFVLDLSLSHNNSYWLVNVL